MIPKTLCFIFKNILNPTAKIKLYHIILSYIPAILSIAVVVTFEDLQFAISVLSVIIMLIVAHIPIYMKLGRLQGEIEILKQQMSEICSRVDRIYNGRR